VETKRKKYKKRGGTSFKNNKGSKKSKYTYKATVKPCARAAKLSANVAISALSKDTYTFENDSVVKKLCEEDVRKLIHLFYVKVGCPPPEVWHGIGGTISETIKALAMSADERRKVKQVITDTYHSLCRGEDYNKGRASRENVTEIADGSKIQQLVADYREHGLSYSQTTLMINMYCKKNNLRTVRRSAVVSCEKRMTRMVVPVTKRPQGSLDKKSNWARARYGWVTQLLVRIGVDVCLDQFFG
jgi:hypothetical protein